MSLKSLKQIRNLAGKRVLLRVDFNVALKNKKVVEDARLLASMPTIEYLIKQKAKVILLSHLGRPEGVDMALSLNPVAKRLEKLLKRKVSFLEINKKYKGNLKEIFDQYFIHAQKEIKKMKNGQIMMLENVRFLAGEGDNDEMVSKQLASLGDLFILDGFAVAHRASSSVVGIAKHVPTYAGLLLEQEVSGLSRVMTKPAHPFVLVLGGIKTETKLPIIKRLLPEADYILIGGGILNTYLKAGGYGIGNSVVDDKYGKTALQYCRFKKIIKPIDVIVGVRDGSTYRVVQLDTKPHIVCKKNEEILDIGPLTIGMFNAYIKQAQTIIWNGAMGYFEQKPYNLGTLSVARSVASQSKGKAHGVIGGGETIQAMQMTGMSEYVDLISTGGGAMLEFLSGKQLPGVAVVTK